MQDTLGVDLDSLTLEVVDLAELRPHPRNYVGHPPDQIAHLVESIRVYGVYKPVVIANDGTVLAGHGVREAAREAGRTRLPVRRLPFGPDHPLAIKILLGDNEVQRLRDVDDAQLRGLLRELSEQDQLFGTGYDPDEVHRLLELANADAGDPVPAGTGGHGERGASVLSLLDVTIADPRHHCERGEVWDVGPHLLYCADVMVDWAEWAVELREGDIFVPYPGPFIPLTLRAGRGRLLMVQPDPYVAGHILDRYAEVNGEGSVASRSLLGRAGQ